MKKVISVTFLTIISILSLSAQTESAKDVVKKADEKQRGSCNQSTVSMKIIRPTWQREVRFKGSGHGHDFTLTLILSPAKEKGQSFLKRKKELWSWNPAIARMIKLPPSMLSQGWMGSDYTNEDILKESSIVEDYSHVILGNEIINGYDCYKIKLTPLQNAAVTWGSLVKWISKKNYMQMKTEFYDENQTLVRTDYAYDVKKMDDRELPTRIEIVPVGKPGYKTVIITEEIKYSVNIPETYFSQQNLKYIK